MNSSERIAVERYAKAYNELSPSGEQARTQAQALQTAARVLSSAETVMSSPKVSVRGKKDLVSSVLQETPRAADLVSVLLDARRYHLLGAVALRASELAEERLGIKKAIVYSANELDARQRAETEKALSARYGGKVEAVFKTDKTLLGGLKIWCSGELIDGSLEGKLVKMEQEISR